MDKSTFNFLQKIAFDYKDTKQRIKEIEQEIMHDSKRTYEDVQPGKSSVRTNVDTTGLKAITLVDDNRLMMLRNQIDAVDYALSSLIEVKREFIIELYWGTSRKNITELTCKNKSGISERTGYRWRREFLSLIAEKMGLLE